jgi:hypothetical protein
MEEKPARGSADASGPAETAGAARRAGEDAGVHVLMASGRAAGASGQAPALAARDENKAACCTRTPTDADDAGPAAVATRASEADWCSSVVANEPTARFDIKPATGRKKK